MANTNTATTSGSPCDEAAPPRLIDARDNTMDDDRTLDDMSKRLRHEALDALREEPELTLLLHNTVLAPGVRTFEDAVATTITYRLLLRPCHDTASSSSSSFHPSEAAAAAQQQQQEQQQQPSESIMMFCPNSLRGILARALHSNARSDNITEGGHTMAEAVRRDARAVVERDPAVSTLLEVVLFLKGFAALVCHRAAYYKWHTSLPKKSMTALWLQSQASAVFGLDIHPAATMGAGILLDHGTGVVIGETATVGDGCTLLHGVTLGGTGKAGGDRHPKVGKDVLIGAHASLLGNIPIGDGAKIGAGSIVLGPIPSGATAVGAPAKVIGRAIEAKPGSLMDEGLHQVSLLHKSESSSTVATASLTATTTASSVSTTTKQDSISEEDDTTGWNDDEEEDGRMKQGQGKDGAEDSGKTNSVTKRDSASYKTNCCCPLRDFVRLAQSAPKGSITICTLRRMLNPEGCSVSEVGEVFFALDTRNVGYVKPDVFFCDSTKRLICQKAQLPEKRVDQIMSDFQEQWSKEQKLLNVEGGNTRTA